MCKKYKTIMKSIILHSFAFILVGGLVSCANEYSYDDRDPEAYKKHWENNEYIKDNKFLYQISEECKENKETDCIDVH